MLIDEPRVLEVTDEWRAALREAHPEMTDLLASDLTGIELRRGIYQMHGFNTRVEGYHDWPEFGDFYEPNGNWRCSYGVCDNVEQVLAHYPELEAPGRQFFVTLVEVRRDEQSESGGWRWHKWGPYIGTHDIQCEYLYDEVGIERVFCYHIREAIQTTPLNTVTTD